MWHKFVIAFLGWVSWLGARFLYGPVSHVYRFLVERQFKKNPAVYDMPWSSGEVLEFFRTCHWRQDPWGGALDVVSKPETFFETHEGDCDEFAVFAATVLQFRLKLMLSIVWWDPKKSKETGRHINGHNVCMFSDDNEFYHIGNWGIYGPFTTFEDVVASIVPEGATPLAWSVRKSNLKYVAGERIKQKKE